MKNAAITFDLDLVDHLHGGNVDEMLLAFPLFQAFCNENNWLKTTWFIRIDDHMKERFGHADYIFREHADKIDWLRQNGHEIGWHFHSFRKNNGKWKQNTDEQSVSEEILRHYPLALQHGLKLLRMGWTYHTNHTIQTISNLNLLADCSAMPRPNYSWEISVRNWENTPTYPYYPSCNDYRIPGNPHYKVLQFPLTVTQISAPYDTEPGVLRYINPCYHTEMFKQGIHNQHDEYLNLICHPYEFLPSAKPHAMLSFSFEQFSENLKWLHANGYNTCTIGELVQQYLSKQNT